MIKIIYILQTDLVGSKNINYRFDAFFGEALLDAKNIVIPLFC
jgi:hypothetical protein